MSDYTVRRLDACFDSHVHWAATGEFAGRLDLHPLTSPQQIANLKVESHHHRGEWLLGFGWDDSEWSERPTRQHLDAVFPSVPVAFSRRDGHSLWVNSKALQAAGLPPETPGVLVDQECEPVNGVLPVLTRMELRSYLLRGVKTFNDAGFTHIRDMTCDENQWNEAVKLDESGLLTVAVEEYFWLKDHAQLGPLLELLQAVRRSQTPNLRVKGLKLFLDGALGSEGAWLSRCYHGTEHAGRPLWSKTELQDILSKTWAFGFEVAVHAIGDAACDLIVETAGEVNSASRGKLHIEHGQVLQPKTVAKMAGLSLECHLQPSHWLSDRRWLDKKLGDELMPFAFPWRRLQEANIAFDFGSDAPIERASLARTLQALRESSEAGVPRLLGSPANYMCHRDLSWAPNSFTLVENDHPTQVVFRGEHLL